MSRHPSTFTISITPFDTGGGLDETRLRGHLRRLGEAGIGVYVGGGGSGEGYTLDRAEMRRVLEIAREELQGRVPVRAMGVEPRTAREMIEFASVVADVGLDALQVYSLDMGHGHQPDESEVEHYLTEVLDAVTLPVVLSSHQAVGYFIPVRILARLVARYDQIVGLNVTNQDLGYLVDVLDAVPDDLDVHVGGPTQALTALSLGASGYLSSEGNLIPRTCEAVTRCWERRDQAGAAAAFEVVIRLFTGARRHGGIRFTKAALEMLGLPGGWPRPPRQPVTDPHTLATIKELLDETRVRSIERLG